MTIVETEEARLGNLLDREKSVYQPGVDGINGIWGKTDESALTNDVVRKVQTELDALVTRPEPNAGILQAELRRLNESFARFQREYSGTPDPGNARAKWIEFVTPKIDILNGVASRYQDYISDIVSIRASLKQALSELKNTKAPYTSQGFKTPKFVNKDVVITVSCQDDISKSTDPRNVTFTAYYTRLPFFDLSAGPLFSLLGRHQVGTVGQTAAQKAAGVYPNGTFQVTDQSSFQVIPMAFAELHTPGFKCPWARRGDRERRFGHVCSVGIALGAGPNNASGDTQAEFFEGISFAIQRVSFLFGFHDGRVEQLGGGYSITDGLPSPGYSPVIIRSWTVRPAFGITYRLPLH